MVGHHKLVHDLGEGLRRARGYSLPREHARMQAIGRQGSLPAKTLIISYKRPGRISASRSCHSLWASDRRCSHVFLDTLLPVLRRRLVPCKAHLYGIVASSSRKSLADKGY